MRFMIMVKADQDTEAGVMPSEELLTEMGKYNEELVKAGVMLAGAAARADRSAAVGLTARDWSLAAAARRLL
ncbi:MAG: YciI family protein [Pseudonocardiaceae bacterium]